MSGLPFWKSAEIGLFRPFSAFVALFRRARRAPGKSRKRRKKAFFLRYPRICLNPLLLNPTCGTPNVVFHEVFRSFYLLRLNPLALSGFGFRPISTTVRALQEKICHDSWGIKLWDPPRPDTERSRARFGLFSDSGAHSSGTLPDSFRTLLGSRARRAREPSVAGRGGPRAS